MTSIELTPAVLLFNLPPSSLAGIDLLSFTTTPRFLGIKNLPPGFHFIFTSPNSSSSIRHGAWFQVKGLSQPPDLFIFKWDPTTEVLVPEADIAEILRWRANLGSLWRERLTPYRQSRDSSSHTLEEEKINDWPDLTDKITEFLLNRITYDPPDHWSLTSASSAKEDIDDIPGLTAEQNLLGREKELRFIPVELKRTWREGATGRERTDAARDRSWMLGDIVIRHCRGREMELIGELQFTFLMVLILSNYSCLEQWKRVLSLLFTCKRAVETSPELFVRTLRLLKLQLQRCEDVEGGLFDLSDDGAGFLKILLKRFKRSLEDLAGKGKSDVVDELDELEVYIKGEHGWELDPHIAKRGMLELEDGERVEMDTAEYDEDDEEGEYAPVIVELTSDQANEIKSEGKNRTTMSPPVEEEEEDDADLDDMDMRY
ncbi:hypothetical protein M501DRAFT_994217 [Patellaria atrata CBS 101060]|uniref:AAR2 domain-containing protein n=1 Tax=Patellaria atrata CBS 101060 TaxID=1346257 RepID=A0A9P4SI02_9PEZI|nr:hypothetical protein M501DRAFT_994217 [Patellaria atrata CBS 101060]